jgi:hypothetical protein
VAHEREIARHFVQFFPEGGLTFDELPRFGVHVDCPSQCRGFSVSRVWATAVGDLDEILAKSAPGSLSRVDGRG